MFSGPLPSADGPWMSRRWTVFQKCQNKLDLTYKKTEINLIFQKHKFIYRSTTWRHVGYKTVSR